MEETINYVACFNCGGTGMVCEFCKGDGMLYESHDFPDDMFRLEEVFPNQGFTEKVCPVCKGTGEVFLGEEGDEFTPEGS